MGELSPADGGNGGNHPTETDIRNESDAPGIMYPKGAAVAGPYTYDPLRGATQVDPANRYLRKNTINPDTRKVNQKDIDHLHLEKVIFDSNNKGKLGVITGQYH